MKKLTARLSLGLLSLAFPLTAFAAAPDNVTGIKATLEGRKVTVTWNKVTTQEIASYRVFYSHTSILKENGLYDDFDFVSGTENTYVFPSLPRTDMLYVSVLAVNKQGEESPFFAEEASVQLRATTSSAAASVASVPAPASSTSSSVQMVAEAATLRLLKAEKMSSTGVLLTFSNKIAPLTGSANTLFSIEFGSGFNLPVTGATVSGSTVLVKTYPLTKGTVYLLQVTGNMKGMDAGGKTVSMDPLQLPTFVQEATSSSSAAPAGTHPEVTNLRLRATAEGNGRYTVDASWNAPNADGVEGFVISQSIDGGATFGPSLRVTGTSRGISIPRVNARTLGVSIRTLYKDGQTSKGIFQAITLGSGQTTSVSSLRSSIGTLPPVGSVTGGNGKGGSLPESGVNIWAMVTLAGAAACWKKMRAQRVEA